MEATNKSRFWYVLVAISILMSSLFFGTYKRTMSATLGEIYSDNLIAKVVCDTLSVVLTDPDHCQKEYQDYLEEQELLNN